MPCLQRRLILIAVVVLCLTGGTVADAQVLAQDLKRLSLEELMDLQITLVTRQPEPVGEAAAAVSVITGEDIRRSGVTTLADALALATGVHVARVNPGSWSITARGFNGSTPNKLLVMIDGRTEVTPFFTGVFWNTLDYVLEDIDRIEVIRGPGATLWGANAVNAVVNIITRHSRETRGTLVSISSGNEEQAIVEMRHGGGSDETSYRVYGKFAERDAQRFATGASSEDGRSRGQAGLRFDAVRGATEWLFKTDIFHSRDELIDRRDAEWTHIAVQGRMNRKLAAGSDLQVQSYYRREYRNVERQLTHHLDTFDLDAQHAWQFNPRNSFIWGAAARVNTDGTHGSTVVSFDPSSRTYPLFSVFAQDEIAVRPESVFVTAGLKVEHNAFSGADWQPNVRGRWLLPKRQVLWGAIARAARRPTRFDDDIRVSTPTGLLAIQGSDDFLSEEMTGWEAGYRARVRTVLAVDATVFQQWYDQLRSQEAPTTGFIPLTLGNTLDGRSSGVEIAVELLPMPAWRVHASYTYLDTEITRDASSRDVSGGVNEFNDPSHLFSIRTAIDVADDVEIDAWLRSVGALPNPAVPGYNELNARIAWRPTTRVEVALIGQDLLHARHPEFGAPVPNRIEFERSLRAALTLRMP